MIIGVPKEIKEGENRVSMTPAGVHTLVSAGHHILFEEGAGVGSGLTDEEYARKGPRSSNRRERSMPDRI